MYSSYFKEREYEKSSKKEDKSRYKYCEQLLGDQFIGLKEDRNLNLCDYINNNKFTEEQDEEKLDLVWVLHQKDFADAPIKEFLETGSDEDFITFFNKVMQAAIYLIKEEMAFLQKKVSNNVINSIEKMLYPKVKLICIRSLILDFQLFRNGKLIPKPPESSYEFFEKEVVGRTDYIIEFLGRYPVLHRTLCENIKFVAEFAAEVLLRLRADQKEIEDKLCVGKRFDDIREIHANVSDSHNSNRVVVILLLDNGVKIVYKPHSIKNEIIYQDLLNWLYEINGLSAYHRLLLEKDNYGWESFEEQQSCLTVDQAQRYYVRFGMAIFLSYILGTTDLHYENVIAFGEYPIFIDLETLIGNPERSPIVSTYVKIKNEINKSVLCSGLMPFIFKGKNIDFSAIKGVAGQILPFKLPKVINSRTADICVGYEAAVTRGGRNRVYLGGVLAEPKDYLHYILKGYVSAYEYCLNNKTELMDRICLLANLQGRYLVRDTQQYSILLGVSYHPNFLVDGAKRNILFYRLYGEGSRSEKLLERSIVDKEIDCLLKGDIPLFTFDLASRDIKINGQVCVKDFFMRRPVDTLIDRVNCLNKEDLITQTDFISMTIDQDLWIKACHTGVMRKEPGRVNRLKLAAERIGDRLCKSAVYSGKECEVGWKGIWQTSTGEWNVGALKNRLYDGIPGIAVFMHAINRVCHKNMYDGMCGIIDETLFRYTDGSNINAIHDKAMGAFTGEYSMVYTYQLLYSITGNEVYLEYSRKHLSLLEGEPIEGADVIDGGAGAINILINSYLLTKNEIYLQKAKQICDNLKNSVIHDASGFGWKISGFSKPLAGFAHGSSGIAYSLLRLSRYIDFDGIDGLLKGAFDYENSLYDNVLGNWLDLRGDKTTESPIAWCHGAGGILLGQLSIIQMGQEIKYEGYLESIIERCLTLITKDRYKENKCLCHGLAGNIMVLDEYSKVTQCKPNAIYQKELDELVNCILCDFSGLSILNKQFSFMTGLPGIGYMLLSQVDKGLPNILNLSLE